MRPRAGQAKSLRASSYLFRHLLETFKGERRQAVKDWLEQGLDEEDQ